MTVGAAVMLLALSAGAVARRSEGALRVHAGRPDLNNEFPFIVMLQTRYKPFRRRCSGSLIASNWVLSAVHCLNVEDPQNIIIKYGDFNLRPNETKLYTNIIKTFLHPGRRITNLLKYGDVPSDDIGLVLVEKILNKPTARLMALDYKTLFGLPVKYAGFGLTSEAIFVKNVPAFFDMQFPPRVGEGIVKSCIDLDYFGPVLCIASKCSNRNEGPRRVDSGGPLVYGGRIIGVAKAVTIYQGVYTPVSIYFQWIRTVMRSNSN